jgi:NAD(P)-dependent dehydrogenase (short-subunit alcohol dehydrogenase family)
MNLDELTQLYNFNGRVIVVTGGTGILGGEIACALVGCNASVALIDRFPAREERLSQSQNLSRGRYIVIEGDVLQRDSMERAAQRIMAEWGKIDGLINAAGGNKSEATTGSDRTFFDLPEAALRFMADQKKGVILNISSMNAFRPLTHIPAYSAAKAAVSNFTQWLAVHMALEYSPEIRVNAIAPGFFLTEQNRFLLTDKKTGKLTVRGEQILYHTPMHRFGSPADLLGAALWLLSPMSQFVTGVVLPIDGGFSAYSGV